MLDPTYDKKSIKANPVWHTAWLMSECLSDNAPLNWSKYIWVAEVIVKEQIQSDARLDQQSRLIAMENALNWIACWDQPVDEIKSATHARKVLEQLNKTETK
jgi:hypothetical protein